MPGIGGLSIANNLLSNSVQLNLNSNQKALQTAVTRLSSGLRINTSADDPSGLAIAEKLQAQVNGFDQATRNVQDANNAATVAEGALRPRPTSCSASVRSRSRRRATSPRPPTSRTCRSRSTSCCSRSTGSRRTRSSTGSPCSTGAMPASSRSRSRSRRFSRTRRSPRRVPRARST